MAIKENVKSSQVKSSKVVEIFRSQVVQKKRGDKLFSVILFLMFIISKILNLHFNLARTLLAVFFISAIRSSNSCFVSEINERIK